MEYTIESRKGMQGETLLSVTIPEAQIDEKALYTMETERPDFLVPFHYRYIDGNVEFIYTPLKRLKLLFFAGERSQQDYVDFWRKIVSPLERCEDWFMRADGFVLDLQHVYYDKDANEVCYLYVPARGQRQDTADIRQFLQKVASQFTTANSDLTVRVLGYLLQDGAFEPEDFLKMLAPYAEKKSGSGKAAPAAPQTGSSYAQQASYAQPSAPQAPAYQQPPVPTPPPAQEKEPEPSAPKKPNSHMDDGFLNFMVEEEGSTPKRDGKWKKPPKAEKVKKEKKPSIFPFGKKEKKQEEAPQALRGGAQLEDMPMYTPPAPQPTPQPAPAPQPVWYAEQQVDGVTQLGNHETQLRYIGNLNHPVVIPIHFPASGLFRIGRYDVSTGKRQCDFEFPPDTPAVSRRHAAIGQRGEGYYIVDLGSRAGTYLNERKLGPNEEPALSAGDRIAFGNAGANYIFEP